MENKNTDETGGVPEWRMSEWDGFRPSTTLWLSVLVQWPINTSCSGTLRAGIQTGQSADGLCLLQHVLVWGFRREHLIGCEVMREGKQSLMTLIRLGPWCCHFLELARLADWGRRADGWSSWTKEILKEQVLIASSFPSWMFSLSMDYSYIQKNRDILENNRFLLFNNDLTCHEEQSSLIHYRMGFYMHITRPDGDLTGHIRSHKQEIHLMLQFLVEALSLKKETYIYFSNAMLSKVILKKLELPEFPTGYWMSLE